MKNPLRKPKKAPEPPIREQVLARLEITDTDRMDRLVKHSGASREEIDVALRADKKFVRGKLVDMLKDFSYDRANRFLMSECLMSGAERVRFERQKALQKEVERMLTEECAA